MLLLAACSGSVEFSFGSKTPVDAAVDLIESEAMMQRLMVGEISDATCDEPPSTDEGTTFICRGLSGGKTIEFEVLIEPDDRIFAGPTNVVAANFLDDYATGAVQALNAENGFTLADDSLDCGTTTVVLDENRQMPCLLSDGDDTYDTLLTVRDTELGTFGVEIVGLVE